MRVNSSPQTQPGGTSSLISRRLLRFSHCRREEDLDRENRPAPGSDARKTLSQKHKNKEGAVGVTGGLRKPQKKKRGKKDEGKKEKPAAVKLFAVSVWCFFQATGEQRPTGRTHPAQHHSSILAQVWSRTMPAVMSQRADFQNFAWKHRATLGWSRRRKHSRGRRFVGTSH